MTTNLPARLEAAAGSRELSDEVLLAMGWKRGICFFDSIFPPEHPGEPSADEWETAYYRAHGEEGLRGPDPTRSVDDGLALLAGMGFALIELSETTEARKTAGLHLNALEPDEEPRTVWGRADEFALALCAALVRARAKQQEDSN